jgi:hypothetical protein
MKPDWSNVYNKVSVRLSNKELGITAKEVNAGSFLDMVSSTTLNVCVEDMLPFERILAIADISRESVVNN